jgi:hypothetical protein
MFQMFRILLKYILRRGELLMLAMLALQTFIKTKKRF